MMPMPEASGDGADVYGVLGEIFRDVFMRNVVLRPELTAKDVPGWDSFKQIEIIVALEERYAIKFHTRELDSLHTVGDLARVLAAKTRS
jgi:acyl carrier protein